ncbi:MAG TPA: hypothetical protein VGO33_00785 [Gemmatimonadaceae bacterium]|nr:hypothetical protein [Gemmatimonadaceae bacterium]
MLRTQASAMRLVSSPIINASPNCLDAELIAAIAERSLDLTLTPMVLGHLRECPRCCCSAASVARLLEASDIRSEVDRLDKPPQRTERRRDIKRALVAMAAAAALVVLVDRTSSSRAINPLYREESVTGYAAPRLVAPLGAPVSIDDFGWTSVARADHYRITVFARDGSVVWEALTRDTVITPPDLVRRVPNDTVFWRVAAHVGWEDRWTSSDLGMLTVPHTPRRSMTDLSRAGANK